MRQEEHVCQENNTSLRNIHLNQQDEDLHPADFKSDDFFAHLLWNLESAKIKARLYGETRRKHLGLPLFRHDLT